MPLCARGIFEIAFSVHAEAANWPTSQRLPYSQPGLNDGKPTHNQNDDDERWHAEAHPTVQPRRELQALALVRLG